MSRQAREYHNGEQILARIVLGFVAAAAFIHTARSPILDVIDLFQRRSDREHRLFVVFLSRQFPRPDNKSDANHLIEVERLGERILYRGSDERGLWYWR